MLLSCSNRYLFLRTCVNDSELFTELLMPPISVAGGEKMPTEENETPCGKEYIRI